ncbi:MAG: DUF4417 domain-containing protein [Bacillota bacterium]
MPLKTEKTRRCGGCCATCRIFKACGGCHAGCGAACCVRDCSRCIYICCRRPGAESLLASLGGPELPALPKQPAAWPGDVPKILPAVAARFSVMPAPALLPWVGINAARMVITRGYNSGGLRRKTGSVREFARISPETRTLLHMYIPDEPLEAFWQARRGIYPALREFDLVIAPNFSVYEDSPRMEHLINIKRSALVWVEMLQAGIRAAPDVSWAAFNDLERWAAHINKHSIPVVSASIQTVGRNAGGYWRGYLEGLAHLARKIPPDTIIIMVGAGTPAKMRAIQAEIRQRVVFLTTQPFLLARKGRLLAAKGRRMAAEGGRDYDAMFLRNVQFLQKGV